MTSCAACSSPHSAVLTAGTHPPLHMLLPQSYSPCFVLPLASSTRTSRHTGYKDSSSVIFLASLSVSVQVGVLVCFSVPFSVFCCFFLLFCVIRKSFVCVSLSLPLPHTFLLYIFSFAFFLSFSWCLLPPEVLLVLCLFHYLFYHQKSCSGSFSFIRFSIFLVLFICLPRLSCFVITMCIFMFFWFTFFASLSVPLFHFLAFVQTKPL